MPNLYEPSGKQRIQSIDILRGVIMLIMALDHTRGFFHNTGIMSNPVDLATTTPALFFTRWITHFCAPGFVFLSGVSAYLAGTRRTKSELSNFLIKRGLWLVVVEVVIISFAFSLNPHYNFLFLQILWAIGLGMVILGLLVRAPLKVIAVIGALIFFGHDILDYLQLPKTGVEAILLKLSFISRESHLPLTHSHIAIAEFAPIPWTGIMLLGYVCGSLYKSSFDAQRRRKILLYTGIAALAFFLLFRYFNIYGDPSHWTVQRNGIFTFLSFLKVSKYPPSLMYSCMTLGLVLIVLSLTEHIQNKLTDILIVYGSVPFFYYVLHFYLLRIISVIVFFAQGFRAGQIVDPGHQNPYLFEPPNFGFGLGGVYLIWLFVIIVLYFPCRWFSGYKKTHNQWWLSYL